MEMRKTKYDIIYADPPWRFETYSQKGKGRSAEQHYGTQGIKDLKNLNVLGISNSDCVLLMWATYPCLTQAIELGQAWGFSYKTVAFTWVKKNPKNQKLFMGMGYYTRSNAELVLLFTKGKCLKRISRRVPQVLISERGAHSEKPEEIRRRIVELFGDLPRVELFARNKKENFFYQHELKGWDVYGNEIENSITFPI